MKMDGSLIVTGGSSGIGKAVLEDVGKMFRSENLLNIDARAAKPIDVRDFAAVDAAINSAVIPGQCNYLFSAAGVVFFTKNGQIVDFINEPIEQLRAMVEINFLGTINVLKSFISTVYEHEGTTGNIVVVSSISSFFSGGPNMAVYDATKAAISAICKRLVPYRNIRINVISPGSVRTNIGAWDLNFRKNPVGKEIVRQGQDADAIRIGKEVKTKQIAEVTNFLFFADHGMNGADLVIDEGLTLAGREGY